MAKVTYEAGDYVRVVRKPADWEGGTSSTANRSLIGHIGVVVEVEAIEGDGDTVLVRFPHALCEHATAQMNIETAVLELVSSPKRAIDVSHYVECGAPGIDDPNDE